MFRAEAAVKLQETAPACAATHSCLKSLVICKFRNFVLAFVAPPTYSALL